MLPINQLQGAQGIEEEFYLHLNFHTCSTFSQLWNDYDCNLCTGKIFKVPIGICNGKDVLRIEGAIQLFRISKYSFYR